MSSQLLTNSNGGQDDHDDPATPDATGAEHAPRHLAHSTRIRIRMGAHRPRHASDAE
jgi:hypothetical protein